MFPLWATLVLLVAAALVLLYQGGAILLAYLLVRFGPAPLDPATFGLGHVSVVIAARNEEDDLGPTLDGILAQDYPDLDVVVVDGGSTDRTREVASARGPRVRCLSEPPLPPGWIGKSWACWTGAHTTDGPWLLFLDADVRTDPSAVRTVLAWAVRETADIATIGVHVEMVGFWERLILPLFVQRALLLYRPPRFDRPGRRAALNNGQFWLTRRSTYESMGGHAAVRGNLIEDVAIARRFRDAGLRVRFAWAPSLGRTRMYRDRKEMFEGLLKNVHGVDYSSARQLGLVLTLFGGYLLPLGLLPLGLAVASLPLVAVGGFLYVALFGKHIAFSATLGAPWAYGLLYPIGIAWYIDLAATSLVRGARGLPVTWKGRPYSVRP